MAYKEAIQASATLNQRVSIKHIKHSKIMRSLNVAEGSYTSFGYAQPAGFYQAYQALKNNALPERSRRELYKL